MFAETFKIPDEMQASIFWLRLIKNWAYLSQQDPHALMLGILVSANHKSSVTVRVYVHVCPFQKLMLYVICYSSDIKKNNNE